MFLTDMVILIGKCCIWIILRSYFQENMFKLIKSIWLSILKESRRTILIASIFRKHSETFSNLRFNNINLSTESSKYFISPAFPCSRIKSSTLYLTLIFAISCISTILQCYFNSLPKLEIHACIWIIFLPNIICLFL